MIWVAIEDGDCELSPFEKVAESEVIYLIDRYKVNKNDPTKFRMQDTEDGDNILYDGVIYEGGFYNIWIARKYREV